MSPLGRFLLNVCDHDLRVNLNEHWRVLEQFGNNHRIEAYARGLGLTVIGAKHTIMGMAAVKAPEIKHGTVLGMPAVRV